MTTGVPGLDLVLRGGFPRGGVYLLTGSPGAGKTTLANHACFAAAREGHAAVYVTLLTESHSRLLANLRQFDFFDEGAVGEKVHFVSGFLTLLSQGFEGVLQLVRREVKARHARVLVLDGFVALDQVGRTPLELKRFIHELQIQAEMAHCTVFALTSQPPDLMRPEQTMVDGIVSLRDEQVVWGSWRAIEVHKLRGSGYLAGSHSFHIDEHGITVEPRIEAMLAAPSMSDSCITARASTGVPSLDKMLGGGLAAGTTTMLLGPSGAGKTTLALHFLCAATAEEPAVFFGVYETPPRLEHKAAQVGLSLDRLVSRRAVSVLWQPMTNRTLDGLGLRILDAVSRTGARRLVIDGLDGFRRATPHPERIPSFFTALANELRVRGVTTVYTVETPNFIGPNVEAPLTGVSALVENIIFMRFVEMNARLHRLLSVLKVRDSSYDSDVREFKITGRGVELADTFSSAEDVLSGFARDADAGTARRARRASGPGAAKKKAARSVKRQQDEPGRTRRR